MFTENSVANTLATVKNAYRAKKLYTEIPYCRANAALLLQLQDVGYIQSYVVQAVVAASGVPFRSTARVYLKYVNQVPVYVSVRCYWRKRAPLIVSWHSLSVSNHSRPAVTFLVSTDQGLLTSGECVQRRLGGVLLCGLFAVI